MAVASLAAFLPAFAAETSSLKVALEAGFKNPPREARPLVWWHWMNGYATREGITRDLEAMKRVGIGGAQMFTVKQTFQADAAKLPRGPAPFMGPEWRALVIHAIRESDRLGLEFSITNCEGWGQAGGPWVKPADGMQKVVWSEAQLEGGTTVRLDERRPVASPGYYEDIAIFAFPTLPGDESVPEPKFTASETLEVAPLSPIPPVIVLPMPMPDQPQWVRIDFDQPQRFSSIRIGIHNIRDTPDPEAWVGSAFLSENMRNTLKGLPGPHYWELQVSDDGKNFRSVSRVASHGTTPLPTVEGRHFRIVMPVPAPVAEAMPFASGHRMEITEISFGGARLDRPQARMGEIIDYSSNDFSNTTVAADGAIAPRQIVTLTGQSEWRVPKGKWTLVRLGHTMTGAHLAAADVGGLDVDKMNSAAVRRHLTDGMLGAVIKDAGALTGTTFLHVLCDSWEHGHMNWTPLMRDEFRRRRGYEIDPWFATLTGRVVESVEQSERFLRDFRRTIADLLAENYYGTLQEFSHQHGLTVYAEATGHGLPAVADQILSKSKTDIPMGEFWVGRFDVDDTKEAASAGHIYGKNIIAAEAFTAIPSEASWARDPYSLKDDGDLQFTMGVNRMCFHRFAHQPWGDRRPGMTLGQWGSNLDWTNTWWEPGSAWVEYLARCQFMLQRGRFVADACYYYGDNAPVDFRFARMSPQLPAGYDFDACNTETLLKHMKVENGLLVLPSGMKYRVLVLPDSDRMTHEVLIGVEKLIRAGATVVGPKPARSPSLTNFPDADRAIQELAGRIWGECDGRTVTENRYGAGRVLWGAAMKEALGVAADFATDNDQLRYIHRIDGDTEIYFVTNRAAEATTTECTFRVDGKEPELWYPDTGKRVRTARWSAKSGKGTTIPLALDPHGSVFVIFRQASLSDSVVGVQKQGGAATQPSEVRYGDRGAILTVSESGTYTLALASGQSRKAVAGKIPVAIPVGGEWTVEFPSHLGAASSMKFPELMSWTKSPDESVKHFSGTATYRNRFTLTEQHVGFGTKLELDLGQVLNLAEVSLNGKPIGVLWKPPFRIDIRSAAKSGANELEVKVTNLWPNRLIGDLKLPAAQRTTWTSYNPYTASSPLLSSGLLGPVMVRAAVEVPFQF